MNYEELLKYLQNVGKDPSRLIFEDELTGLFNRRFLFQYFQHKISWPSPAGHPVSLIMMDMDHFKEVNDTYGHAVGDQALIFLAVLLREVSGEKGLPIRYAGDEFMVLLPDSDRRESLVMGERLLSRVHEEPFPLGQEKKTRIPITLSIGIASAPEDAQTGRGLIQKADTALYYAKRQGRNRLASAGTIPPQESQVKAALYEIRGENISGRKEPLARISEGLQSFSQGQSQVIFVEGASGMGKTAFLETIHRDLSRKKSFRYTKTSGNIQEMFRPYYLATKFLVELLNDREDRGISVLESLGKKELSYLSQILPHLEAPEEPPAGEDGRAFREGLFHTLVYFLPRVAEGRPLVFLIDDLHLADEASLLILRQIILRGQIPVFVVGTVADPMPILLEGRPIPLESFYKSFHQELNISRVKLVPLTEAEIREHLQKIFPQLQVPADFVQKMERITRGNPLFLGEILCKLVLDQKIFLQGQEWKIELPGQDDLPQSLEAVIRQKIQNLGEEGRKLLFQASALGENVPLSVLTGSSQIMESKVLEFVDQAVNQGLVKLDFQDNDQNLRFRGRRILELTEEQIQDREKREVHDRVGKYQEILFKKFLVPSAAPLVYHFREAANEEKARTYEDFERNHTRKMFNAAEASRYSGERRKELPPPGEPLDPESLALVPSLVKTLLTAVRHVQLYPVTSESVLAANHQVKEAVDSILEKNEILSLFQVRHALMINGRRANVSEFKYVSADFLALFDRLEIQGIIFHRGLTHREVNSWLEGFGRPKPGVIDRDYWPQFAEEHRLEHIELKQIRYTLQVDATGQPQAGVLHLMPGRERESPLLSRVRKLNRDEMAQVPEILRSFLNAAKAAKLYPLSSKNVSLALDQLEGTLRGAISPGRALVLAQVRHALVINGVRLEPRGSEAQVESFLKFLDSNMLTSLTFLDKFPPRELKVLIAAIGQGPPSAFDPDFWQRLAKTENLAHVLFDQVFYEARVTPTEEVEDLPEVVELVGLESDGKEGAPPVSEDQLYPFLQEVKGRLGEMLAEGEERKVLASLKRLFLLYPDRPITVREKLVETCRRMLEDLNPALQNFFAKLLAGPLLDVLPLERDPKALREVASLLHRMAAVLVLFRQYPLAGRILLSLQKRRKELEEEGDASSQRLAKVLDRKLDPSAQQLVTADLKSADPFQHENAVLLAGGLGRSAIPILLEILRTADDLRVRTAGAQLLSQLGSEGANTLRKEAAAGPAEERARILEVLELVTREFKAELAGALRDGDPVVRQAAYRLVERVNDGPSLELLIENCRGEDPLLSLECVEVIGKLKAAGAAKPLIQLLGKRKNHKWLTACCRTLGQIGDPAAIEPLERILRQRKFLRRLKGGWEEVRTAAALALGQIGPPASTSLPPPAGNGSGRRVQPARIPPSASRAGRSLNNCMSRRTSEGSR